MPERLGSIRQFGCSAGRDGTATLPRMSARWSSTRPVSFCTSWPSLLPRMPAIAPAALPPWLAIWPVARSEPLSAVEMFSAAIGAVDANRPARMVQPMSALPRRSASGFSFLPFNPRGAFASMMSRIASAATATGAMTTEVRVIGAIGCSAVIAGLLSSIGLDGKRALSAHSVPLKNTTTINAPPMTARQDRPNGRTKGSVSSSACNVNWRAAPAPAVPGPRAMHRTRSSCRPCHNLRNRNFQTPNGPYSAPYRRFPRGCLAAGGIGQSSGTKDVACRRGRAAWPTISR